jgi:patatin-like phospholipase/acyl hydrolase
MVMSRVISFDGGGVRGVIPVVVLQRIMREPGLDDLLAKTHLFAGTSTGGLIALGLAGEMSLQTLRDVYEHRTEKVFGESFFDDVRDLGKLIGADYRLENLSRQLHDVFGERRLRQLSTRVLVTAFDLDNEDPDPAARTWKPKIFHNFPGPDDDGDQLAYKVGTYTSAAPTYFLTADGYIDGGVFATNPAMCALAQTQDPRNEAPDQGRLDELVMLSLGTGHSLQHIEGPSHNWGYVQWIRPLIDLMLDGVNGIADYQCRQILRDRYCRFAPTFPPDKNIGMDAVDQIPYMVDFAERLDLSEVANWLIANW